MTAGEGKGLCSGCKNAPGCVFPREPGKPLLECAEFEGFPSAPSSFPKANVPPVDSPKGSAREKVKLKGLCKDCENRRTCTFPKSEGGVWHCEEYQ
jgi:hypothetical protein